MFSVGLDALRSWRHVGRPLPDWPSLDLDPTETAPDGPRPVPDGHSAGPQASSPWLMGPSATGSALPDNADAAGPWIRAPVAEVPGFRVGAEGVAQNGHPSGDIRLMAGALAPLEPQEPLDGTRGGSGEVSWDGVPSSTPSTLSAATMALPAVGGSAVDLAALAARAAPAAAAFGSTATAALPFLFIPTNTQSETTDLGEGLRARVRPGQRTVEIERRIDNGLLGTGLGAKWQTLPVEAHRVAGKDGGVSTVINHEQLNQALGRGSPPGNAMAQAPEVGTGGSTTAAEADKPVTGNAARAESQTASRIDGDILEEAKQRAPEEENERLLACRAVRAMPGQPTPPGQYDGHGGIETSVGVRVAPGFPGPKAGYDYSPDYLRHWNGYKGELELKNRIAKAVPYEKFIHYGNPAGAHGPDVLTVGPDRRFMEWDSKYRTAAQRVGPSMASKATLKYQLARQYAWDAMRAGAVTPHAAAQALKELDDGNYNICSVGMGNAYDGYFETVRQHARTGLRR
jgi:hypothetical protein